jgi:hypothetical protein
MYVVQTGVTPSAIRIRFADFPEPADAKEWIDLQVPVEQLPLRLPQGDLECRSVAEIQVAALQHARGVIAAEIRRLEALLDNRN